MKAVFTSVRFVSFVNLLDKSNIAVQGWCFSVRGVLGICDTSATNNIYMLQIVILLNIVCV